MNYTNLIKKKRLLLAIIAVVLVSVSVTSISAQSQYDIPSWVKGIAGFWAEDKITDNEFGEGLAFLIDNEIIKIPLIQELENKIAQLESENAELRKIKGIPRPEPTPEPALPISITVSTDKNSYDEGDLLTIKGLVKNYSSGDITLVVSDPIGDSVAIDQLTPNANGEFTTNFPIGFTFDITGAYKITVNHKGTIATTTFEFTGGFLGHEFGITAKTNDDSYTNLDVVKISGTVNPFIENYGVTTQVVDPEGQIVWISQIFPKFDGTFSGSFVAGGVLWESSGDYVIELSYGPSDRTEITFKYYPNSTITVKTDREQAYRNGDLVRITGELTNIAEPDKVSIMVYNYNGDFIEAPRVFAFPDSFSATIIAGGSMYDQFGEYSVKVFYNEKLKVQTTFWYNPN